MNVIYVDDEMPALDNFRMTVKDFPFVKSLKVFLRGEEAIRWASENPVDVAFLDMEMHGMNGLEAAKELKKINRDTRLVFVTAYEQYALQAFCVDAIGYILKPYSRKEVRKELEKAACFRPFPQKRVSIQTIPDFVVYVDGERLVLGRAKTEELLALLVDHGNGGITTGEMISCLWPGRYSDENTQSLCRMTYKRLVDALREVGIEDILVSDGRKKYIVTEKVDCDLYRILAGDREALKSYCGEYMREYSWAEVRNAQLNRMSRGTVSKNKNDKK